MRNKIFVFGSNLQGIHGAGAAKEAFKNYEAVWGRGAGPQGQSYAIPTKRTPYQTLTLEEIEEYVDRFMAYALTMNETTPPKQFYVTRIGCGLAGYNESQIRPMFDKHITAEKPYANVEFTWQS